MKVDETTRKALRFHVTRLANAHPAWPLKRVMEEARRLAEVPDVEKADEG